MLAVKNRAGEQGNAPLRTDRFFAVQSSWYFSTREGASIGPYTSKQDAQVGLVDFIDFIQNAEESVRNNFISTLIIK